MAQHTPVITGELYRAEFTGNVVEVLCLSTAMIQGTKWGLFRRLNMAFERVEEGSDDMACWELVKKDKKTPVKKSVGRPKKAAAAK